MMPEQKALEFGIYSLGDYMPNKMNGHLSAQQRIQEIIQLATYAEQAGIDVFALGESHQDYFTTQAHTVILGAIAQATKTIRLSSSATVLSVQDPVKVYEDFSTIDLISNGRAEIVAGRGSRVGAYDLFGIDLANYEDIFEEKLALLKQLNDADGPVSWSGKFRPELKNATLLPQPLHGKLPIWRAVGGPPGSAIKAGYMGIPMMLTTLGGPAINFQVSVDAYYEALQRSGFEAAQFPLATASLCYVGSDRSQAVTQGATYLSAGFEKIRGSGYPRYQVEEAANDATNALMVGEPEMIVEKLLYQHELFGMDRFMAQIDFGGVPFDETMRIIDRIGEFVLPEVEKFMKHTR